MNELSVIDANEPKRYSARTILLVAGLAAGIALAVGIAIPTLMSDPVYHGVTMTRKMRKANELYLSALEPLPGASPEMQRFNKNLAQEALDEAIERYKANPAQAYHLVLHQHLLRMAASSGAPYDPKVGKVLKKLRDMDME